MLHEKDINRLLSAHAGEKGVVLLDEIFEFLDFSFVWSNRDKVRIPSEGRLIMVANHPLGGLDGLALLRLVLEIRPDVRIVVNDLLLTLGGLADFFLPYGVFSRRPQKGHLLGIEEALKREEAVIFFPAGEVSRLSGRGIRDRRWLRGPVHLARHCRAPIQPVHISGRNSLLFYLVSLLHKRGSMFLLPNEIFWKRRQTIRLTVGNPIPAKAFTNSSLEPGAETRLLKKHLYRLGSGKKGLYRTERTVAHPLERRLLKLDLANALNLGKTKNGMEIYLAAGKEAAHLLLEIARLRELTFRKVGEGTGARLDTDPFDRWYHHLVLWDATEREVVGAYRMGLGAEIVASRGIEGFYSSTLFQFTPALQQLLLRSIDLGRSFIQEKYWSSRALDYLWQGIGAFLAHNPRIQYLLGPVSISASYPPPACDLLVFFFRQWFGGHDDFAISRHPYRIAAGRSEELRKSFPGEDYRKEFQALKNSLKLYNCTVPILYKHYSDLSEAGGVRFLDFGVDTQFQNCIDGLILVDLMLLSPEKRARYIPAALPVESISTHAG